jgi:hypothetical protein
LSRPQSLLRCANKTKQKRQESHYGKVHAINASAGRIP